MKTKSRKPKKKQVGAHLKRFYAVTISRSVYRAQATYTGMGDPYLVKIAKEGESLVEVGEKLNQGSMISVGRQLTMFIPEGGGLTSYQREIGEVNTRYWGESTSPVVALFLEKKKAMECLKEKDLALCDSRWEAETIKVLKRIGKDHPHCSISTSHNSKLMPSEKWQ